MMTEEGMQKRLGWHLFLKYITIPNVTMNGDGKGEYEADLIYFSLEKRIVTEIEIKVSMQDFKADFKKKRYHDHPIVAYLYYAVPKDLYEENKDEIESLLGDAGLIVVEESLKRGIQVKYIKRAKKRKVAAPLSEKELIKYLRLGCMKWVNRYE